MAQVASSSSSPHAVATLHVHVASPNPTGAHSPPTAGGSTGHWSPMQLGSPFRYQVPRLVHVANASPLQYVQSLEALATGAQGSPVDGAVWGHGSAVIGIPPKPPLVLGAP